MDSHPYMNLNFVDLLQTQQDSGVGSESSPIPLFGMQATEGSNFEPESPVESKVRRTWTPTHDNVLISSWLNTSKDPIIGNEQRNDAFWKRIAAYYSASPKIADCDRRGASQCKNRWHKINEAVGKFCGAFEAATRSKTSGQNETDVLKHAHEIFFNNYKKKFILEHAWKELRHDQKWCDLSSPCAQGDSKRKKLDNGSQSGCSVADEAGTRPPGVKAAKARGKKPIVEGKDVGELQVMLVKKEKMSKMKLLDRFMAKQEPLDDDEIALKKKLIKELLLSN
ncbi:glutathione S-transferase T3-like [Brassica rapa]|uniref:glutathione S-transferase T3-like n=1 Tax=Brassica campestris TaxID=3711 RepID=UPI00142DA8B0|nr:glutathione S-transferase T3-like [Brassica rapa]